VHTRKLYGTNLKKYFSLLGESEDIYGNGGRMTGLVPAVCWQEIFAPDATEAVRTTTLQQPSCSVDPVTISFRNNHERFLALTTSCIPVYVFTVTQILHLTHFG